MVSVFLISNLFKSYLICKLKDASFSFSTKILREMGTKFERSKNLTNCNMVRSVLIFPRHFGPYLWVGVPFKDTMHVFLQFFTNKNCTTCCEGTFMVFNVFLIRRPFQAIYTLAELSNKSSVEEN